MVKEIQTGGIPHVFLDKYGLDLGQNLFLYLERNHSYLLQLSLNEITTYRS